VIVPSPLSTNLGDATADGTHCPHHVTAAQTSVSVEALPSSQVVPSGTGVPPTQQVVVPSGTGLPPTHAPAWQVSVWVQAVPSSQAVPSGWAKIVQTPVLGSQAPSVVSWHGSLVVHSTGVPPTHAPAWQVSVWVQALPSLHTVPLSWLAHAVVLTEGWHAWQAFVGLAVPLA
jgi:hypothetical protein